MPDIAEQERESPIFSPLGAAFADDFSLLRTMLEQGAESPHWFIQQYLKLRGMSIDDAKSKFLGMIDKSASVADSYFNGSAHPATQSSIPKLIHRIWLTNPSAPYEPPTQYVTNMMREAREYKEFGWSHLFWIQEEALLPNTMALLAKDAGLIEIKTPGRALESGRWTDAYYSFVIDSKYPFAADILRMQILLENGGFYADMGAKFKDRQAAEFVAENFDYGLVLWETMFFQNSLMAMPKRSPAAELFMRLVERPDTIPLRLIEPLSGLSEGMAFSGLMITAILFAIADEALRVCPLAPNGKIVSWEAQRSWYTDVGNNVGKHGNAYVPATKPSYITSEIAGSSPPDAVLVGKPD